MAHQLPALPPSPQEPAAAPPLDSPADEDPAPTKGSKPRHPAEPFEKGNQLWRRRDPEAHRAATLAALQRRVTLDNVLLNAVDPDDLAAGVARLVDLMRHGKPDTAVRAAKVLLAYIVPKRPAQAGEVNRPPAGGAGPTFIFQLPEDPRLRRRAVG